MIGLYNTLGVPRPIVVVLSHRLLSFWLPTLGGIALAPILGIRLLKTRRAMDAKLRMEPGELLDLQDSHPGRWFCTTGATAGRNNEESSVERAR